MNGHGLMCFVSSVIAFPACAQEWVNLNPFDQPPGNTLYSVDFVDEEYGWAVGEWGIVLHTSNGGETWVVQHDLLVRSTFTGVDFVNREIGWMVGEGGSIFHTENGGLSWERQESPVNYDLYNVLFLDAMKGWAVGYASLLHTEDGGVSWHLQEPHSFEYSYRGITFVDSSNGWIVGTGGLILHTKDGGQSWQRQNSGLEWALYEVSFVDSLNGWACGSSTIRTTNGGESWAKMDDEIGEAIVALSDQEAFVVGWSGQDGFMKHTTDGGRMWSYQNYGSHNYLWDIFFSNQTIAAAVGGMGLIVNTSDSGKTWSIQHERKTSYDMGIGTFVDKNSGWFVEYFPGRIWHTTDGGRNWTKQKDSSAAWAHDIEFVDKRHGWIVGQKIADRQPFLWRTEDGGNHWQESDLRDLLFVLEFEDSLHGLAGGDNVLTWTDDGGETWHRSTADSGLCFGIWDLHFPDREHGWAVGGDCNNLDTGIILKSTDGGATWEFNSSAAYALGVYFTDRLQGVVVGSNPPFFQGVAMRTGNGGENWETEYLPSSWLHDVVFTSDGTGWIVGDGGSIWKTSDRAQTWVKVESGTAADLKRIVFVDDGQVGYVFGEDNTLLLFQLSNNNVVEEKRSNVPQRRFELYPSNPNPFDSETRIEYVLSEPGYVQLQIIDLAGRVVVTLVNCTQSAGRHTVAWNGRDERKAEVVSGVYFGRLVYGDLQKTVKFSLVR